MVGHTFGKSQFFLFFFIFGGVRGYFFFHSYLVDVTMSESFQTFKCPESIEFGLSSSCPEQVTGSVFIPPLTRLAQRTSDNISFGWSRIHDTFIIPACMRPLSAHGWSNNSFPSGPDKRGASINQSVSPFRSWTTPVLYSIQE